MSTPVVTILRTVRIQLLLAGILVLLEVGRIGGAVPEPRVLLGYVASLLERYGLGVLTGVSFFEHLVGVNVYFPGSVAILVGVSSLSGDAMKASESVAAVAVGAIAAHHVNYVLGRRTPQKPKAAAPDPGRRSSLIAKLATGAALWHPHFGALAIMIAGREGLGYREVGPLIVAGTLFWDGVWGVIAFSARRSIEETAGLGFYPFLACLLAWALVDCLRSNSAVMEWVHQRLGALRSGLAGRS